jgi:hypothetical protein
MLKAELGAAFTALAKNGILVRHHEGKPAQERREADGDII